MEDKCITFLAIDAGGLMHTKMRLFSWDGQATNATECAAISGSLNHNGNVVLFNNETLMVIRDEDIFLRHTT